MPTTDFKKRIIENSSGVWRGDIQEQRGTFEACGQAAYRGWVARFEGKMGFVPGALFFGFVFFWARKRKWKPGLEPPNLAQTAYCEAGITRNILKI